VPGLQIVLFASVSLRRYVSAFGNLRFTMIAIRSKNLKHRLIPAEFLRIETVVSNVSAAQSLSIRLLVDFLAPSPNQPAREI